MLDLQDLRTKLWDALEDEELAEEALAIYDILGGFLTALLIDAGGVLECSDEALKMYEDNIGNLRIRPQRHGNEHWQLFLTDREDKSVA